jgi:hypothetical protein
MVSPERSHLNGGDLVTISSGESIERLLGPEPSLDLLGGSFLTYQQSKI